MKSDKIYYCFNSKGVRAIEHLINIDNLHLYLEIFNLAIEAGYTDIAEEFESRIDEFRVTSMPIESYKDELYERFKKESEKRLSKLFSTRLV